MNMTAMYVYNVLEMLFTVNWLCSQ